MACLLALLEIKFSRRGKFPTGQDAMGTRENLA
jgi:hypothetical protein